jgi:hypothetical protein
LFGDREGIVNLDAEIAHGAPGMAEQKLDRAQIAGATVDQRSFGATQGVGAEQLGVEADAADPVGDQAAKAALELIGDEDEYVFPSPRRAEEGTVKPIEGHALAVSMRRFGDDLKGGGGRTWKAEPPSPHDLGRTLRRQRTFFIRFSSASLPGTLRRRDGQITDLVGIVAIEETDVVGFRGCDTIFLFPVLLLRPFTQVLPHIAIDHPHRGIALRHGSAAGEAFVIVNVCPHVFGRG